MKFWTCIFMRKNIQTNIAIYPGSLQNEKI